MDTLSKISAASTKYTHNRDVSSWLIIERRLSLRKPPPPLSMPPRT